MLTPQLVTRNWQSKKVESFNGASRAEMRLRFLSLRLFPAALSYEEAGWITGFTEEEIGILVAAKKLSVIGKPPANGKKRILTAAVIEAASNEKWMNDSVKKITDHWKFKNGQSQKKQRKETT